NRDARGGTGQVIDLAIYEALFSLIGQQVTVYDRLGVVPQREGNAIALVAPRNVYRTGDGRHVALAAATPAVFGRVMLAIERPELADDARFADNAARLRNRDELDAIIGEWMERHTQRDVLARFERHEAA